MKKKNLLISLITVLVLLMSCTAEQKIKVGIDGSGSIDIAIKMEDFLVTKAYLLANQIMPEQLPPMNERNIFDEETTRKGFEETKLFTLEEFKTPSVNELIMKISFNNINDIIEESKKNITGEYAQKTENIISYKEDEEGIVTVSFYLDKYNFKDLQTLIPEDNAKSLISMFAPVPDIEETEESYIEFLAEFFEQNTTNKEGQITGINPAFEKAVKAAYLKLEVEVGGEIISVKGGTVKDGKIFFNYRILDILILNDPVEINIVFKKNTK
ncbi:MAG: hypothetical protein JXR63_12340 [Spirochaetales bacterium]|nr:hypothetical protein [Spirochaetales bacterium]